MPDRLACDEAMYLSKARLKVQDPDLKDGRVEKATAGQMLVLWGLQGGFAVVYKFRTQSGKMRALRCYLIPMKSDIQYRYELMGAYFAAHIPDITAEFKYHNNGIVIAETVGSKTKKPYTLIEMEWIEGTTLIEHVAALCRRRDRARLVDVVDQWVAIIKALRRAKIAHCDLAGGNIMVRPNGHLVLVDYDGVYIPDFMGMAGIVEGQADYQHPEMSQRPFNEHADNFSAMVIYAALLALHLQPELWDSYTSQNTQNKAADTNLLFKKSDYIDPDNSRLFSELDGINDARLSAVVRALKQACRQAVTQVQILPSIIDPDSDKKEALCKLEQAIQQDDDEEIVKAWISTLLDTYAPAQQYHARFIQAKQLVQKLKDFRYALQTGSIQQIINAYNPILAQSSSVKPEEYALLQLAQQFREAYDNDDDDALADTWDKISALNYNSSFILTWQESQRSTLAQQRKAALVAFRQALSNKKAQEIVDVYDQKLDGLQQITPEEREVLQLAKDFIQAYNDDDDQDILDASNAIEHSLYSWRLNFTTQEEQRISLARRRIMALEAFRRVQINKNIQHIVSVYDPVLDHSDKVTFAERDLLGAAKNFVQADHNDNDQAIVDSSEVITQRYQPYLIFTVQEEQRIALARQRIALLTRFRKALTDKHAEQIVAAYDCELATCKNVTREERELLALAFDLVQAYRDDDDQAIISTWQDIQNSLYQNAFVLTPTEEQRFTFAQKRVAALHHFRTIMNTRSREAEQIVAAYAPVLDNCTDVTPEERTLLQMARYFKQMYDTVLDGVRNDSDEQILSVYDEAVAQHFADFTQQQQERINKALKWGQLEMLLQNNDYGDAIRLAHEIEMESHKQIVDFRLTLAKSRFMRQFEAKDVVAWRQGDEVVVQWRWPPDDLIRYAVIVWRIDRWPQSPKREEPGTGRERVLRARHEQACTVRFNATRYMAVYLQVYFAIPDNAQQPPTWFYSDGNDPGSRTAAYYSGPGTKVI